MCLLALWRLKPSTRLLKCEHVSSQVVPPPPPPPRTPPHPTRNRPNLASTFERCQISSTSTTAPLTQIQELPWLDLSCSASSFSVGNLGMSNAVYGDYDILLSAFRLSQHPEQLNKSTCVNKLLKVSPCLVVCLHACPGAVDCWSSISPARWLPHVSAAV